VLPTPIPNQREGSDADVGLLVRFLQGICPNHVVSTKVDQYPKDLHRSVTSSKTVHAREESQSVSNRMRGSRIPHGFRLEGLQQTGEVCGIRLPAGLRDSDRLPQPSSVRPRKQRRDTTKYFRRAGDKDRRSGKHTRLKELTLSIYNRAVRVRGQTRDHHMRHEIRIRTIDGVIAIVDEMLTPDSPVLAGRPVFARQAATVIRQAIRAGLSRTNRLNKQRLRRSFPRTSSGQRAQNTLRRSGS